jgi:hypothetical protein
MKKMEKKADICPLCKLEKKKEEPWYSVYRDKYRDEQHPDGRLRMCSACYIGKRSV